MVLPEPFRELQGIQFQTPAYVYRSSIDLFDEHVRELNTPPGIRGDRRPR